MAVGVIFVRGNRRQGQSEQYKAGGQDIAGRLQPVRDHRGRMAGQPGEDFDDGKRAAHHHSDGCDALADLHSRLLRDLRVRYRCRVQRRR